MLLITTNPEGVTCGGQRVQGGAGAHSTKVPLLSRFMCGQLVPAGPSRRSNLHSPSIRSEDTAASHTSEPHLSQTVSIAATYLCDCGSKTGAKDQL